MSIFRVNKNKNYTIMSNYHLRDRNLSLKAKGLLSLMLSLPDTWDYSMNGLISICKESDTAIKSALDELKVFGYLTVWKIYPCQNNTGRISYIYDIFEEPVKEKTEQQGGEIQGVENLGLEIQGVENQVQLNTNIQNTNIQNTNNLNNNIPDGEKKEKKEKPKKPKKKYGEYQHVLLTDDEYDKLKVKFSDVDDIIAYFDRYIERKGYKAKSHYLCILDWVHEAYERLNHNPAYWSFNYQNNKTAKNQYVNDTQTEYNDLEKFYK